MLHKHPSAEKAQKYFGITDKAKRDAANFFIYIQPKFGDIYDISALKAFGPDVNLKDVRDKHLSHLSTLLAGGIDHNFILDSHSIFNKYAAKGITTGEYIKFYQLVISYFSGEAHKKYWWRYKKYRDLNRAIRNLMLFDLAIGTSPREIPNSKELENFSAHGYTYETSSSPVEFKQLLSEMQGFIDHSYETLVECYHLLQQVMESHHHAAAEPTAPNPRNNQADNSKQPVLNGFDPHPTTTRSPKNKNDHPYLGLLMQTHKKVKAISGLIGDATQPNSLIKHQDLNHQLQEILSDLDNLSNHISSLQHDTPVKEVIKKDLYTLIEESSKKLEDRIHYYEEISLKSKVTL